MNEIYLKQKTQFNILEIGEIINGTLVTVTLAFVTQKLNGQGRSIAALFRLQVFSLSLHHIKSLDTCMEY